MSDTDQSQEIILDTKPKPFVFVLMPFDKAFTDVYRLGIKTACEKAGAYAERLDEQLFAESMLQRIYNQIAKADVIVADMTDRNPNVFYEVGYAHALGKVVILLTRKDEDIPFDLKHYPHIIYGGAITDLIPQLEGRVKWAIGHAKKASTQFGRGVMFYCRGIPLSDNPTLLYTASEIVHMIEAHGRTTFTLGLTCGNNSEIAVGNVRFALWTSDRFDLCQWGKKEDFVSPAIHPAGWHVFGYPREVSLFPGAWVEQKAFLYSYVQASDFLREGSVEKMMLQVSTETGSYSYPFTTRITADEQK